jgi:uncharacterized Fe-S radical SAM superfamily protein PflX
MNALEITATNSTPEVVFNKDGKLLIKGKTFPENVDEFYKPIFDWAEDLRIETLTVDIELEYINSASSKKLLHILKLLDTNNFITELKVIWRYDEDDEDILESGEIYEEFLIKARFSYFKYKLAA